MVDWALKVNFLHSFPCNLHGKKLKFYQSYLLTTTVTTCNGRFHWCRVWVFVVLSGWKELGWEWSERVLFMTDCALQSFCSMLHSPIHFTLWKWQLAIISLSEHSVAWFTLIKNPGTNKWLVGSSQSWTKQNKNADQKWRFQKHSDTPNSSNENFEASYKSNDLNFHTKPLDVENVNFFFIYSLVDKKIQTV